MRYADLHCDTLTVCADRGLNFFENGLQADIRRLKKSGCAVQCFAIFTEGENAKYDFLRYYSFYESQIKSSPDILPVYCAENLKKCVSCGILGGVLTVENLSFIGENLYGIAGLKDLGVRMASLVWNNKNLLASPDYVYKDGKPQLSDRNGEGLSDLGRQAVEELDKNKIIVDISHLSDGGAEEILSDRKIPVVASHSCAATVHNHPRNLTGGLIKKIADCGGTVGVNYCPNFLGGRLGADGGTFERVYLHISRLINIGGEDCVSLGSDFDGIKAPAGLESCLEVPALLGYLGDKLGGRVLEKLCLKNFARVFEEVCG